MGRKKSKISKKKQAKAAARTCAKKTNKGLGGIPASKGGLLTVPAKAPVKNVPVSSTQNNTTNKRKKKTNVWNQTWEGMKQKNSKVKNSLNHTASMGERADFDSEFASMQERHYNQVHKKGKKGKNQVIEFTAPTLVQKVKTAEDLVNDAADQISQMVDVGQRPQVPIPTSNQSSLLQAMAQSRRTEGFVPPQSGDSEGNAPKNMFAAFEEDSEGEEGDTPKNIPAASFSFTAPTFSFQSSFQSTQSTGTIGGGGHALEDDPDL